MEAGCVVGRAGDAEGTGSEAEVAVFLLVTSTSTP